MKLSRCDDVGYVSQPMSKEAHPVDETPLCAYGVCCNSKANCSLSYESEELGRLTKLLQAPNGSSNLWKNVAGFTKFFQYNSQICSVCHKPVFNTARGMPPANVDGKKLEHVLRLRNQLLGLEILPA